MYATEFKQPRQYIHVQPFSSNHDLPDYDMDCDDIKFFEEELRDRRKMDVTQICFEDMIDRLEKNSTTNAVTIKEAKLILKEDDDLILLVYDYWLNKRLSHQQGLVPVVRTVNTSQVHNPYICFRRRTEKMQTRKNRKNEEASYESMLKLRRDLTKAVTLLQLVKRREKTKKEKLNLTLDIFDKRYAMKDFDGRQLDAATSSLSRYRSSTGAINIHNWISLASPPQRKTYKSKKKYFRNGHRLFGDVPKAGLFRTLSPSLDKCASSEDDNMNLGSDEEADTHPFTFVRKEGVQYRAPLDTLALTDDDTHNYSEAFHLTAVPTNPETEPRCLGFCRRRLGRGGRGVVDRLSTKWSRDHLAAGDPWLVRPVTPPHLEDMAWDPYMVRNTEEASLVTASNNNNKVLKMVDMNKSGAHNAAGALVDSQFLDLFSTAPSLSSGSPKS